MKITNILLSGLVALTFASCDKIAEDNRYLPPIEFEAQKNVLIEDYTGQKCLNCPTAAETIHAIQGMYGANVIPVAIHGGSLAIKEAAGGLATDDGEKYVSAVEAESFPIGRIDRIGGLQDHPKWSASVIDRLQVTTPVTLSIANEYDATTKKLKVTVDALSSVNYSGKLQLWIVEDGIVAVQRMPSGAADANYVHNHVFRSAINDLWGEDLNLEAKTAKTVSHEITLNDKWVADNVSVVAFVYNDGGVEQSAVNKIITK